MGETRGAVEEYRTVGREHGTFTDAIQGFVIYARCSRSDCRARDHRRGGGYRGGGRCVISADRYLPDEGGDCVMGVKGQA
jgi:hypothetical protein